MKTLALTAALIVTAPAAFACETVTLGDLAIEHAWSRATIGADRSRVFYVEVTNAGAADDALIGIATPAAGMPMLHETVVTDGVAPTPTVFRWRSFRLIPNATPSSCLPTTCPTSILASPR